MPEPTPARPRPRLPLRKPSVLLIEDNVGDAVLVQTAMTEVGFACSLTVVENFVQAYRFLLRRYPYADAARPDLILLDLNLPVMSGRVLLRDIRSKSEWRNLPVIVFSSSRRDEDRREAAALGALAYIPKPPIWSGYIDAMREVVRVWRSAVKVDGAESDDAP